MYRNYHIVYTLDTLFGFYVKHFHVIAKNRAQALEHFYRSGLSYTKILTARNITNIQGVVGNVYFVDFRAGKYEQTKKA